MQSSSIYSVAILFGGISVMLCTVVNECPENRDRFLAKTNFCDNSSLYHCLPDEECKLHQICIQPVKSASVFVLLNVKGTLFPEYVDNISNSNIDVYELFSLFVCKLSVLDTIDTKLFDKILQKLNVSVPKVTWSYTKTCDLPTTHHYLATLDCKMKKSCNEPRNAPNVRLYIYNESAFKGGRLNLHEFNMGKSNSSFYYRIGFILCTLEMIKVYHEEEFDNKDKDSWILNLSDVSGTNVTENTELNNPEIIAGVIVGIIASCIVIALTFDICWRMRGNNWAIFNTKKGETERQIQLLNKSENFNPSEMQVNEKLQEQPTEVMHLMETHKRAGERNDIETLDDLREVRVHQPQDKELSTDVENSQEDRLRSTKYASDYKATENLQCGKQTVHIRVEDYEPSVFTFKSSDKPLMPRDIENTFLLEDTKTLTKSFCDEQ